MARPTRRPSGYQAQKRAHARRTTSRVSEDRLTRLPLLADDSKTGLSRQSHSRHRPGRAAVVGSSTHEESPETADPTKATPAPTVPPVIFHSGTHFVLREAFAHTATYQAHRRRMEALTSFDRVLTELERLSKRLLRASHIDRRASVDEKHGGRRARIRGTVLYRRRCVAYDFHFRVPYAQRFLNTLAQYNALSKNWRELASRGMRVVDDLLYRSDWRGQGRRPEQRERRSIEQLVTLRRDLSSQIRPVWRRYPPEDVLDREEALKRLLAKFNLESVGVPRTVLKRPPSRVVEFILSQHFGVWQIKTRPASSTDIELLHG